MADMLINTIREASENNVSLLTRYPVHNVMLVEEVGDEILRLKIIMDNNHYNQGSYLRSHFQNLVICPTQEIQEMLLRVADKGGFEEFCILSRAENNDDVSPSHKE